MNTVAIKKELVQLIESEEDASVLEAVHELLTHKEEIIDPILKEKMISRALKAEEDIKAGRIYSEEEFYKKLNDLMKK